MEEYLENDRLTQNMDEDDDVVGEILDSDSALGKISLLRDQYRMRSTQKLAKTSFLGAK